MKQKMRKIIRLGIFCLFLLGAFSSGVNTSAQNVDSDLYAHCGGFNDAASCGGSPSCVWQGSLGSCTPNCDLLDTADARRKCRAGDRKDDNATEKCEDIEKKAANPAAKAICDKAVAQNNDAICDEMETTGIQVDFKGYSSPTSAINSFMRKCRDAVRKAGKADGKYGDSAAYQEAYLSYEQFPAYTGPVFDGPGLRAGARIAKTKLDNTISKERDLKNLIIAWTKFILSLTAVLAVVALVWAGFLYVTDLGDGSNSEKAKKIIIYVAGGIVLILGSYAIVNTIMKARFGASIEPTAFEQNLENYSSFLSKSTS